MYRPAARFLALLVVIASCGLLGQPALAGSEDPPEGPPWVRELAAAQREALEREIPIFVYLTKTYCPHCVKLENEVLCKAELEPIYDKAVWLYVYRDFSGEDADLAAERVALRLGFSSYPQHHLLHPATLERIATPPRSIDGFLATFGSTSVEIDTVEGAVALAAAEERAKRLETKGRIEDAIEALENDDDIVVRFRAVQVLAAKKPAEIIARCGDLMKVPNDLLRYEVCETLMEHGDTSCARVLDAVVEEPTGSLNPNVLRIRAVQALGGACGDAASIEVIAPFARGPLNNGLTKISVTALRQIGQRERDARDATKAALVAAYPMPPAPGDRDTELRAVMSLAKHVHEALVELTGKKRKFPSQYDAAAREKLIEAWS